MDIETLAHTDSLEQLAAYEDYNRFLAEQAEETRLHMEAQLWIESIFGPEDQDESYDSLEDQLSH